MNLETILVILLNVILWGGMYLMNKDTEKKFKDFEND